LKQPESYHATQFERFLWRFHSTDAPHYKATTTAAGLDDEQLVYAVGDRLHHQCSDPTFGQGVRRLEDLDDKVLQHQWDKLKNFLKGWNDHVVHPAAPAPNTQNDDYLAGFAAGQKASIEHAHQREIAKPDLRNHKANAVELFGQYLKLFPAPTTARQAKMKEVFWLGFECSNPVLADFCAF
jgi:hypothetical protein